MGPDGAGNPIEEIVRSARRIDVGVLLLSYDTDFDIPMRQRQAIGLLQLCRTISEEDRGPAAALSTRVGEAWCQIVRADVEFELRRGLADVDASRDDARRLLNSAAGDGVEAYVAARWHDGAGRLLYRIGSHARARIDFETATEFAERHVLWWCLPDLRSNLLRASWEEARQVGTVASVVDRIEQAVDECVAEAHFRNIDLDAGIVPGQIAGREFLRGFSSLLHNLAVATLDTDPPRSLALSHRASSISTRLGDVYRLAQAVNHQAQLVQRRHADLGVDPSEAGVLYRRVRDLGWVRGSRIAEQNLAKLRGGRAGARDLARLLETITAEGGPTAGSAGLDIDLRQYTVRAYAEIAESLAEARPTPANLRMRDDAHERELELARSVRRVVALPAYKRAYSTTVRPVYLRRIERGLAPGASSNEGPGKEHWEDVLTLIEESSSRELLDMMSGAELPLLGPPASAAGTSAPPPPEAEVAALPVTSTAEDSRRSGLRRSLTADEIEDDRQALLVREQEFESQFLRRPLAAAPHDTEIARTAERYAVNHPGTIIVRYFGHGFDSATRRPTAISAFVVRDAVSKPIRCAEYPQVRELVAQLLAARVPTETHTRQIWRLLIEPLWPAIEADDICSGDPHLVLVPSDDLFAVPFHVASRDGYDSMPLGALLPMSQSVSLTAFLTRARHLLRRQRVEPADELAAVVVRDENISARELVEAGWDERHLAVAGDAPAEISRRARRYPRGWTGLAALSELRPEFFLYAGHGRYHPSYGELGPYLDMRGDTGRDRLTPYDVALRIRLTRNRLTVLAACLAGQGTQTAGGDVSGFLRAFIAAGAGAIALPLWEVLDGAIATTAGHLLAQSRCAAADGKPFDAVRVLHEHYRSTVEDRPFWIDHMPLALYT